MKIKNRKALFLDLIGTGYRLHQLRGVLNYSLLICCHLSKKFSETYHKPEEMPAKWISFIDNPDAPNESKNAFYFVGYEDGERYIGPANEVFNRATHNSPIRLNLAQVDEKILPLVTFSQVNDTKNFDVFEACLHEVLNSNIVWSNLRRKDILEYLLKIFKSWVRPHSFFCTTDTGRQNGISRCQSLEKITVCHKKSDCPAGSRSFFSHRYKICRIKNLRLFNVCQSPLMNMQFNSLTRRRFFISQTAKSRSEKKPIMRRCSTFRVSKFIVRKISLIASSRNENSHLQ